LVGVRYRVGSSHRRAEQKKKKQKWRNPEKKNIETSS